jgi:hypothetical protein
MSGLPGTLFACNQEAGPGVNCFDNPRRKKYKHTVEKAPKEA